MSAESIKYNHCTYNLQSWAKQKGLNPVPIEKADGIYMWDFDGNRYTDMSSQLVNLNVGHGNRAIIDAIKEQAEKYCYLSPSYGSEPRGELAKMIIGLMPDNMGKVFFTNGGADANENAVKIARMYTGRQKVFSRYRSYHGSTYGAGNLTGEPRRYPLEPGAPGFVKFFDPYIYREKIRFATEEEASEYYVAKLREQVIYEGADNVAAIVMETITGSNGVIIPPKGYLKGVRAICDEFDIMMICDEVMAGFGRTGKMFAFENFNVKPDIVAGVPDSGTAHAVGYANESGIPFSRPFIKYTPTWPRSFMPTIQSQRNLIAKMKLLAVEDLIKDKSLLLIDDSIVRGTQLRETTEYLFDSGAKEVHIRPACPPLVYGCKYLNFSRSSSEMDLITRRVIERLENGNVTDEVLQEYTDPDSEKYEKMVDEICKELHFTSLRFNRLDDMLEACGVEKCKLCTYCWDGKE